MPQKPWEKYQQSEGPWTKYADMPDFEDAKSGSTTTAYPPIESPGETPSGVAGQQALNAGRGIIGAVPAAATSLYQLGSQAAGVLNPDRMPERIQAGMQIAQGVPGMVSAMTQPFKTATQQGFELAVGGLPQALQIPLRYAGEHIAPGISNAPPPESPESQQAATGAGNLLGSALLGRGLQAAAGIGPRLTQNETAAKIFNAMGKVPAGRRGTQLDIATGEFKTLPGRAMVNPEAGPYSNIARALTTSPRGAQPIAAAELKSAGQALSKELAGSSAKIDIHPIIPLDEPGAFTKFNSALDATGLSGKDLSKLTPSEVNALRSDLGSRINWSPTAMTTDANEALMDTYSRLNSSIGSAVPAARPITKRLQEALLYNRSLAHTIEQGAGHMPPIIRGAAKYGTGVGLGVAAEELIRLILK